MDRPLRVGLVLGGGAVQGAVWLEGALAALAEQTGWDPAQADIVVGTSAGSWLAALLAAGVPPWLLAAQSSGERIDGLVPGRRARPPAAPPRTAHLRTLRPGGSLPLVVRQLRRPLAIPPTRLWAGAMPRGVRSTGAAELVRTVIPTGWPERDGLWIVACDYRTGRRVVFGRDEPRPADVADAVEASCAVPVLFRPATIDGREYVDGGLHSVSNLDVVKDEALNLVICLNPASTLEPTRARTVGDVVWSLVQSQTGARLGLEAHRVRRTGTPVLLLQPTRRDLAVLGQNWMRPTRLPEIIAQARETVAEQIAASPLGPLLAQLPAGRPERIRRPDGPVEEWPPLVAPPAWAPEPAHA